MCLKILVRTAREARVLESSLDRRRLGGICKSSMFRNQVVLL